MIVFVTHYLRCIDAIDIAILAAGTIFCAAVPGIPDGHKNPPLCIISNRRYWQKQQKQTGKIVEDDG